MWLRFTKPCPAAFAMLMSSLWAWSSTVVQKCAPGPGNSTLPGLKAALQRAGCSGLQLLEGTVKAALQVRVGHNQDTFLVPRHQADLLRNACVQLNEHKKQNFLKKKVYFVSVVFCFATVSIQKQFILMRKATVLTISWDRFCKSQGHVGAPITG